MAGNNESLSWKFYLLNSIVLGALLALAEVLLGGFIRNAGLPRSPLVSGFGFAVMAVGLAVFKQARIIFGIAVMAVLGKWLSVPLLGLPIFCQANAHLAVLLNGACLFAGVSLFRKRLSGNWKQQGAIAGFSAMAAGTAFFALARFWTPCRHLLSFRYAGGTATYLLTRVAPAILLAAVFFPLGYALGRKLEVRLLPVWLKRTPLLAPLAGVFTAVCLGLTVLLTAAGF
jgi:hypothetical protein